MPRPPTARRFASRPGERGDPAAVEAEPVDDSLVLGEAIEPLAGIAGLRPRRHRAGLDEAEAERQHGVADLGMLVEAGGEPDRIGKGEIPHRGREDRVVGLVRRAAEAELERLDGEAVGALRVEQREQRPRRARTSCPPSWAPHERRHRRFDRGRDLE